jgi:circadian clock protein KaiC
MLISDRSAIRDREFCVNEPSDASTGIEGLDDILNGGFEPRRLFLLEGSPGTGKTTIALQFLQAGLKTNQRLLYITLSETREELISTASSHGWTLGDEFAIFELQPPESLLNPDEQQTILYSSDLDLGETTQQILAAIERANPTLLVLDSLSEIRLLAQSSLRYRRQLLALKHIFAKRGITVLLLDDLSTEALDKTSHSIAHGVLRLEELSPDYGAERRRLKVMKYRSRAYRGGYHDFAIKTGGVQVFPRLVASEHKGNLAVSVLKSGIPEMDLLLGGGIDKGSSTLVLGPAGNGKSLLTLQCADAAMRRGEKVGMFIFDEEMNLLFRRAKTMGIDLARHREDGLLRISQVDAAELSPGEFSHNVQQCVADGVQLVIIDSLNGYRAAMPEERSLLLHIHELLQYLNRSGVSTFLTVAQHGVVGDMETPVDVTYLADTVILMRYFEAHGRVRRAISVVKKRTGGHEDIIREFHISSTGMNVGPVLQGFQGVLRGIPTLVGAAGINDGLLKD